MARILVQTNDRRTVLDQRNVRIADIDDEESAVALLDRLADAIQLAEARLGARRRTVRHLAAIVPASDYRDVSA